MRKLLALGILVAVFFYLKKRFGTSNDLQSELKEQRELKQIGNVSVAMGNASLPPLSMLGDMPLAGIYLDPFNPNNPAARPKALDLSPVGTWPIGMNVFRN